MRKRFCIRRSRSVAMEASMKGCFQPPAYSLRYDTMMCRSASSRASRSVSAMMTSRVTGHSAGGAVRPAAARAEDEAAVRHDVEESAVLGEAHRVIEGRHQDVRAEKHLRGAGGEAREDGQGRRPVVVDDGVMLLHPHGGEAELFGAHHLLEGVLVVVAALDGDEADLELRH